MLELKIFLVRNGLTQTALAGQLGITKQYLSDILNRKRKAKHVRTRMIQEFGVPAELVQWDMERLAA